MTRVAAVAVAGARHVFVRRRPHVVVLVSRVQRWSAEIHLCEVERIRCLREHHERRLVGDPITRRILMQVVRRTGADLRGPPLRLRQSSRCARRDRRAAMVADVVGLAVAREQVVAVHVRALDGVRAVTDQGADEMRRCRVRRVNDVHVERALELGENRGRTIL